MDKFTIHRNSFQPLKFSGILIGEADNSVSRDGNSSTRWVEIRIWRTKGNQYVTSITRRTRWQGECDYVTAGCYATADDAIASLKDDEGRLGVASQAAVEKAASADEGFASAFVEEVE